MPENSNIRIDKFLWAIRLYKTRSIASEECRKGRILIRDIPVKPSRTISAGEIITVRKPPVTYTYRVIEPIENRVSAKLVPVYAGDLTPESEKVKLEMSYAAGTVFRQKGTGRPTKRERRLIDRLRNDSDES